jgi:hypothetical protein
MTEEQKPRLRRIPAPADPEKDRRDLSKPYPIQIGELWYATADELEKFESYRSEPTG